MIATGIIAALLLAMAIGQLSNLRGFIDVLDQYELGRTTGRALAAVFLLTETAGGVLLALSGLRVGGSTVAVTGAVSALLSALIWTLLAVQAYIRKLPIRNCGCFGVYLPQRLSGWILVQDALFVSSTAYVVIMALRK